jgi:acyl dehydratase
MSVLPPRTYEVRLADLVRYAGAGGDFNPIHWNERSARAAGLPGVIAHGMYTMALAGRYLTDWAGDPAALRDFRARFTAPVVVPDDEAGSRVDVGGQVLPDAGAGWVLVEVEVRQGGRPVLVGRARVAVGEGDLLSPPEGDVV